ncbi:MAG: lactate dehydrogenase [Firmicutes bacterium]|nr:lactate dehydrogenase [Bacillota bacterium]
MRRLHELCTGKYVLTGSDSFVLPGYRCHEGEKVRLNILAMGDVGGTLALGLRLLGADAISRIGICDIDPRCVSRWEHELNQIAMPDAPEAFPEVLPVPLEDLFDCDAFVFCASRGVPELGSSGDVRMLQLDKNRGLIRGYAQQAAKAGFDGEFFVVSDPVDPLCMAAKTGGISASRIQGFGLGVMNGRALYYARRDPSLSQYLKEGRVFGPHGEDLVVADSVTNYDDALSRKLTDLTVTANLEIREMGFKPYIAPAIASGALSILENLRGHWHYSSAYLGSGPDGAFLGMRNRRTPEGLEAEDQPLDDKLYARIERAYRNLEELR